MTLHPKAVFLSYASQDAQAVQAIAEALRAAGIEAWFDQDELRGGDAWDSKIRGQVKACALFVPVISANTQARSEGYFRREWNLAVDRMLDLADDTPFLLPVLIDDTPEAQARVPGRFRERQWTRVTNADAAREFARHVRGVLDGEIKASVASVATPSASKSRPQDPAKRRRRRIGWIILAIVLLAIFRPWEDDEDVPVKPKRKRPPAESAQPAPESAQPSPPAPPTVPK
jgi:hypothetical protein